MTQRLKVVVAGGGMAGLAVAALLNRARHAESIDVTLIDAGPRPEFLSDEDVGLRVSAISPGSEALLARAGAWQHVIDCRHASYEHMRVWDADESADGSSTLSFDADEFARPHLGTIVENVLVQHALLETLKGSRVELRFATRVDSVETADVGQRLALDTGEEVAADLLIAADGSRSPIREALGIGVTRLAYPQSAFVTHVTPEREHRRTAWQRFLPTGPIGLLPLADGRVSVVWSTTPEAAARAMDDDDDSLATALGSASDYVLGRLQPAGPRGTFPLAAQHADEYVRQGVVLVGDAAHTVHPLAGQGANLGFADARSLVETIEHALDAGEVPTDRPILRRYERERRGANALMMHALTGLNRLFASNSAVVGQARRTGMLWFNRAGPLRRRIVEVAFGAER